RGRLFLQARDLAHAQEGVERGRKQLLLEVGVVDVDDLRQGVAVGKLNVVKEATAQEGVGEVFLVVGGDDHQRPVDGADGFAGFVHMEFHAVEFAQEIV